MGSALAIVWLGYVASAALATAVLLPKTKQAPGPRT
jgi:hypothetical protein